MNGWHDEEETSIIHHLGRDGETDMAVCFIEKRGILKKTFWVPKSVIVDETDREVEVKAWWAEREGY